MPATFVANIVGVHGDRGAAWLRDLPARRAEIADRWDIDLHNGVGDKVGPLTYHYVTGGRRRTDHLPVVLKMGPPSATLRAEAAALRIFDGRGAVRLLDADDERGALLLERVRPGTPLTTIADDEARAVRCAATVMRNLWRPLPREAAAQFPTIADWARGIARHRDRFDGGTGPLPAALFARAEALIADLLESAPPVLLHGDLHHGNLLGTGGGTYVAIDPHGVVGDPAFEPSAFLLNPEPRSAAVLSHRVGVFAEELGIDQYRIRGWGIARAVLSACWTIEDGGNDCAGAIAVGIALATVGVG